MNEKNKVILLSMLILLVTGLVFAYVFIHHDHKVAECKQLIVDDLRALNVLVRQPVLWKASFPIDDMTYSYLLWRLLVSDPNCTNTVVLVDHVFYYECVDVNRTFTFNVFEYVNWDLFA